MLLQINHITKTYNVNSSFKRKKQTVLNDISLSLNKGDSIALIGESGCGKSTLGKIIAGLLHRTAGKSCGNKQRFKIFLHVNEKHCAKIYK